MSLIGTTAPGASNITLAPYTNTAAIQLGSAAPDGVDAANSPGILGLTSTELSTITGTGNDHWRRQLRGQHHIHW